MPARRSRHTGLPASLAAQAASDNGLSRTRTCGCSSRPASRAARARPGTAAMRCTGPLAMSAVVWPARLTRLDVGALRDEVLDHLVVAARGGVVQRGVALVVARVDVGAAAPRRGTSPPAASRSARGGASWRRSPRRSPTPAAACSGGTPGPPTGTGGRPDTSLDVVAPPASPVRGRPAGLIVGMFGSAPCATSSFIASTSAAYAARQNGVAPISSTPGRSKL